MIIVRKQPVVDIHQFALTNSRSGLLGGHIVWPGDLKLSGAQADGTGGYQDQFVAGVFQIAEDFYQLFSAANVQPAAGVGQSAGADFYNDTH